MRRFFSIKPVFTSARRVVVPVIRIGIEPGDGRQDTANVCELAGATGEARRAVVFGGEHFRVIGIEGERASVLLLLAEPEEAINGGTAVGAVNPVDCRAPFEFGGVGGFGQWFARANICNPRAGLYRAPGTSETSSGAMLIVSHQSRLSHRTIKCKCRSLETETEII